MKRRILSMILAICLALALVLLTSCSAINKAERALEKTEDLDSYNVKLTLLSSLKDKASTTTPAIVEIQAEDPMLSDEKEHFKLYEGSTLVDEYYRDELWVYVPAKDGGYKMSHRNFEASGVYLDKYLDIVEDLVDELDEELLRACTIVENEDGSLTLSCNLINGELMEYEGVVARLKNLVGITKNTPVNYNNAKILVNIDGGYVQSYELSFEMEYEGNEYYSMAKAEYVDAGKNVSVKIPEGYKETTSIVK